MRAPSRAAPEDLMQQHLVKMLRAYGRPDVLWFAVPNGEYRHIRVGAKLKRQGVRAGAPDLVFCIAGRFHAVEFKAPGRYPSPAQIAMRLDVERAGGWYYLCTGLDQAIECLVGLDVFLPNIRFSIPTAADGVPGVRERPRAGSPGP
jgi:hypothetical protein